MYLQFNNHQQQISLHHRQFVSTAVCLLLLKHKTTTAIYLFQMFICYNHERKFKKLGKIIEKENIVDEKKNIKKYLKQQPKD